MSAIIRGGATIGPVPWPSPTMSPQPRTTDTTALADRIDALLPQTQCTKCGHPGCRPYAEAIADGTAQINRCPPGGAAGIEALAALLGRPPLPLDTTCGLERPLAVAMIDEALCIGCTLCIQACPVDCILGAPRKMHTVIASQCTGCDLCVAHCPTDCIAMVDVQPPRSWTRADAAAARRRHDERASRHDDLRLRNEQRLAGKAVAKLAEFDARDDLAPDQRARKKAVVEAAIARARARRTAASARDRTS
jgi:electron transport complex protein RnfB